MGSGYKEGTEVLEEALESLSTHVPVSLSLRIDFANFIKPGLGYGSNESCTSNAIPPAEEATVPAQSSRMAAGRPGTQPKTKPGITKPVAPSHHRAAPAETPSQAQDWHSREHHVLRGTVLMSPRSEGEFSPQDSSAPHDRFQY